MPRRKVKLCWKLMASFAGLGNTWISAAPQRPP